MANEKFTDPDVLFGFLRQQIIDRQKYYLFFDEIQQVRSFEKVINSLRATDNVSIFITGSNSQLLSGELATRLSGRYISFLMLPLTFREFASWRQGVGGFSSDLWREYLRWGGMPRVCQSESAIEKNLYIQDLYNTIALGDIIARQKARKPQTLSKINQHLLANLGKTISANSIADFLKNEHLAISPETVLTYLGALDQALLFHKIPRFDVKGKNVLRTLEKYYLCDLCFLRLRVSQTEENLPGRLENIVCNELLSRHHRVYIGKTDKGEIDFAAQDLEGRWSYYQVTVSLEEESVRQREFGAFGGLSKDDPGEKIVLSLDDRDYSRDGVQHYHLIDWLLRRPERHYC